MEYIQIGKMVNTHGVKGEVKIMSYSDFDTERYKKGNTVYILKDGKYISFIVQSFRQHKGFSLVTFQGIQNMNEVEQYKECIVYMNKADRKPLANNEYYRDQLLGLEVIDEEGLLIGTIIAVEETTRNQTYLRILRKDKNDALVPYVPLFIRSVDLEKKQIIIHKEEGLL